jgi:ribosomal protein S18 acetylase RimI-like enzyme
MNFVWRKKYTLIACVTALVIAGTGLGLWWRSVSRAEHVVPYVAERDREAIITLFKDNWYWLIPEETPFSIEYYLDHKTADQDGEEGSSTIMVYRADDKTIGMISYYPMSFYKGRLHFIVVDKAYRGRGISDTLVQNALDAMKKRGFTIVELITRVDNIPAQKLYVRFGFKEFYRDNRFVRFEKELL